MLEEVAMIAFTTLFLGLVVGVQPVGVVVGDEVAAVEILLDGRSLGTLRGEPWTLDCDFGNELAPALLEAVAYDGDNREVGRAGQRLNLPHPPAEVSFVVDKDPRDGSWIGRLAWESKTGSRPQSVSASFDGQPLAVDDPRRIPLPPHDRSRQHLFQALLEFPGNVISRATVAFGGVFADEVRTELTAIPFLAPRAKWKAPAAEAMHGWFVRDGEPLAVASVEKGPSDIVIVLGTTVTFRWDGGRDVRGAIPLRGDQRLRFLRPVATPTPGVETTFNLYPMSPEFDWNSGGLYWLLTRRGARGPESGQAARLADAVAVAGLAAYERQRRRAVILLLDAPAADASPITAEQSRRYLERLQVPFFLWTQERSTKPVAGWGRPVSIRSAARLTEALYQVNKLLDRQRIAWLEGRHLPQDITLSPDAEGIELPSPPP